MDDFSSYNVAILTLGGNMDREVVSVDAPPRGTGDHQRDMKQNLGFMQRSFAATHGDILDSLASGIILSVDKLLNREVNESSVHKLSVRLGNIPETVRILVTAPAGRLIDLANAFSGSTRQVIFTGVDDPEDTDAKKVELRGALEALIGLPVDQKIMIFRGGKLGPVESWKVKLGDDDKQPCDVEFIVVAKN